MDFWTFSKFFQIVVFFLKTPDLDFAVYLRPLCVPYMPQDATSLMTAYSMLNIILQKDFSRLLFKFIHLNEEKFLKSPQAQTITCSFMLYQENIPASCVVSFCVPTGCYGSPLLSGRTLNGREIFRCHSDVLRPGLAKHAFFLRLFCFACVLNNSTTVI